MNGFEFFLGSLEKIFPERRPERMREGDRLCILKGRFRRFSWYIGENREKKNFLGHGSAGWKDLRQRPRMRRAGSRAPSAFPCYEGRDENYLSTQPG